MAGHGANGRDGPGDGYPPDLLCKQEVVRHVMPAQAICDVRELRKSHRRLMGPDSCLRMDLNSSLSALQMIALIAERLSPRLKFSD
jgi:hypothetical protein